MLKRAAVIGFVGLLLLPAGATSASSQIRCIGDNYVSNTEARYTCTIRHVRRNESVEARAEQGCSRFRSFYAGDADAYVIAGASREQPGRFSLRDKGYNTKSGKSDRPLYVSVFSTSTRVKFVNHSRYLVNVSYSMRCPV